MSTISTTTTNGRKERHQTPGCTVPVAFINQHNMEQYVGHIDLKGNLVPKKGKPSQFFTCLNDGIPGHRKVPLRYVGIRSRFGISQDKVKDGEVKGLPTRLRPTFRKTIHRSKKPPRHWRIIRLR